MSFDNTLSVDEAGIQRAVLDFAYRDRGEWTALRSIFTRNATIRTMWYSGNIDEFIASCAAMAARGNPPPKHWMAPSRIDVRDARAVAETDVMIMVRMRQANDEIDVTSWVRFYDLFVRDTNRWMIQQRTVIYERDRFDALSDWQDRPNPDKLNQHPPAYKHLAFLLTAVGVSTLPTTIVNGSAQERDLYEEGKQWLAAKL